MPEGMLTEERGVQYVSPLDETMHIDSQAPLLSPQRNYDIEDTAEPVSLKTTAVVPMQPVSEGPCLATDVEETENLIVMLSDGAETSAPLVGGEPSSEQRTPVNVSVVEQIPEVVGVEGASEVRELQEYLVANDTLLTNSTLDVEDGEIEPDDPDESNVESISQQISADPLDEGKEKGHHTTDHTERDAEQLENVAGDRELLHNTDVPHSEAAEVLQANQKLEDAHVEIPRSQILTRHAGRTTLLLSLEKTRERALSRRTGPLPPSPGKRGGRGAKRSVVLHRGRINPSAPEPEGDEVKQEGSQTSESQSAPAAGNVDPSKEEE